MCMNIQNETPIEDEHVRCYIVASFSSCIIMCSVMIWFFFHMICFYILFLCNLICNDSVFGSIQLIRFHALFLYNFPAVLVVVCVRLPGTTYMDNIYMLNTLYLFSCIVLLLFFLYGQSFSGAQGLFFFLYVRSFTGARVLIFLSVKP